MTKPDPFRTARLLHQPREAVVIGGSAGAIEALSSLLRNLPATCAVPILTVVHLPAYRKSALPEVFRAKCQLAVTEAEDKQPLEVGTLYFAPPDYHLLVEPDRTMALSRDEPVHFSRPAIDVLFQSAADAFGPTLVGIVLTGASSDGAAGLRAVWDAGGLALVQNPEVAEVPTMPEAALEACPGARVLSLEEIAAILKDVACGRSSS